MRFGGIGKPLACAAIAAIAGCLFPSLDALSGGPDASSEGGSDVGAPDVVTDGGAVAFCASVDATFCEDFDDSNLTTFAKWDSTEILEGGSLTRVDAGLSPPNAVAITYDPTSASGQLPEELSIDVKGTTGHIHLVYDLIIDELDTTSGSRLTIAELEITSNGNLLGIREEIEPSGIACFGAVYPNDGGSTFPLISPRLALGANVWHHVDVVVDLTKSPAQGGFAFDGTQQVSNVDIVGATFGPGALTIVGGVYYATQPTSGWKLRIDNIAVWAF
jgi:hypothetical protein